MNICDLLKEDWSPKKEMDILTANQGSPGNQSVDMDFANRQCDSNITLWQFLLELLQVGEHPNLIQWTNRPGEFKLLEAEAVARLWGQRKAKPQMNYDKLSRALRYYYDKDIIKKVIGQKFVYRFVNCPDTSFSTSSQHRTHVLGVKNVPHSLSSPQMKDIKSEYPIISDLFDTSTSPMISQVSSPENQVTPMRFTTAEQLAAINVTSHSSTSNESPSPTESSCSPTSVASSVSNVTVPSLPLALPGPSRPSSVQSDDSQSRKRKSSPIPQKESRRQRPGPLNLSATQYLNPTLPYSVISPLNIMAQMSPFMLPQQLQLFALASASIYGPNSPIMNAVISPFRSPLSTPKVPAQPIFQFPPV
ncbi:unnamed protein product [Auanema sp. JU1783]|nr:unnamed protein product [Auanema sp. JU1783]